MSTELDKIKPFKANLIQNAVLTWFDSYGRKTLPWQENKTPYRVWLSEIMLQQTQVATVIPFYLRFLANFPKIEQLAAASDDQVLHLWTGLGYYSRARNLHKTAKIIAQKQAFPSNLQDLQELPGIGRSTAGAILAIAFNQQAAILDGNVKRVLTRLHALTTWPGEKKTHDLLWLLAESYTPAQRVADYTQAMMDIGATICIRGTPKCPACPLKKVCLANKLDIAKTLPKKKPSKKIPIRSVLMLVATKQNKHVYLEKRPSTGIWGSLWSLPELPSNANQADINSACMQHFNCLPKAIQMGNSFRHTFSHFHLDITTAFISLARVPRKIMDGQQQIWYNLDQPENIGLPAPIKKLLKRIKA
jgi:A/G-specific adenine glycosylase